MMTRRKHISNNLKNGFGLLEVLISIGILALVAAGVVGLGNVSVKNTVISADRSKAYNLAREWKEILKQTRDTKWVNGAVDSWNSDFKAYADDGNKYYLQGQADGSYSITTDSVNYSKINKDGTDFYREITFSSPDSGVNTNLGNNGIENNPPAAEKDQWIIKATIAVKWSEYGHDWSVAVPVYLTDWLPL